MNLIFFEIWERRVDGLQNRPFHKVRYTAALRHSVVLEPKGGQLEFGFDGGVTHDVEPHPGNTASRGGTNL